MATRVREVTINQDRNILYNAPIGTKSPISVDISATDFEVTTDCRAISSISGSVIVVDMMTKDGLVQDVPLPAPGIYPVLNIIRVKRSGTSGTNIRLWPIEE
jgi:hypothetical protein